MHHHVGQQQKQLPPAQDHQPAAQDHDKIRTRDIISISVSRCPPRAAWLARLLGYVYRPSAAQDHEKIRTREAIGSAYQRLLGSVCQPSVAAKGAQGGQAGCGLRLGASPAGPGPTRHWLWTAAPNPADTRPADTRPADTRPPDTRQGDEGGRGEAGIDLGAQQASPPIPSTTARSRSPRSAAGGAVSRQPIPAAPRVHPRPPPCHAKSRNPVTFALPPFANEFHTTPARTPPPPPPPAACRAEYTW